MASKAPETSVEGAFFIVGYFRVSKQPDFLAQSFHELLSNTLKFFCEADSRTVLKL
jgi:hypothetical protein